MMFKPIGKIIPIIRMASHLKDSDKVLNIKEAIHERDKEKVWKAMKNGRIDSLGIEQWKATEPFYGDHIKVNRFGYTYHGIYISKKEVIHFASRDHDGLHNWKKNQIISTSFEEFSRERKVWVRQYTMFEARRLNGNQEIVTTAQQFLGQDGYYLFLNNCEHFCRFCTFQITYSRQVFNWTFGLKHFLLSNRHII